MDLGEPFAVGQRMGLPAGATEHDVALGDFGLLEATTVSRLAMTGAKYH